MRGGLSAAAGALLLLCGVAPAQAQGVTPGRPGGRVEITVGGGWLGGATLGDATASLRAASATPQAAPLFQTETRLAGAPSFAASGGVALRPRVWVEGGVLFSRPELRTSVSGDVEGAASLTVVERVDQYVFDARVVILLKQVGAAARTAPFVDAGAGYLRQLHEGRTVIEQGHTFHAGGGVKHWLARRDGSRLKAVGLRADARFYVFRSGISFDDDLQPHVAVAGGLFMAF